MPNYKPNYNSGRYRLEKQSDMFCEKSDGWIMGETIEVYLTEKEAKNLLGGELFKKLGFVGWSWLGDEKN